MSATITAGFTKASRVWKIGTSDADARTAPMKRLPQSPMNIRAGGRFQYRNPSSAPMSAVSRSTSPGPNDVPRTSTSDTAAASPSMLSSRFRPWQIPANHTMAISVYHDGTAPNGSAPASAKTRNAPIASDETSLASGDSCSRSSSTPTTNMASEAMATAIQG